MILEVLKWAGYAYLTVWAVITLVCIVLAARYNWRALLLSPAFLVDSAITIAGWILVPIVAAYGAYNIRRSQQYPDRVVLAWDWSWMWLWGNEEDGINGRPLAITTLAAFKNGEWLASTKRWSDWRRIVVWAAFRNGASNLRYTNWWGLKIDPRKVLTHSGKHWDIWFVSCGWRSNFWYQGKQWRFWIGWKIRPWDYSPFDSELAEGDPRVRGVGFALQLKRAR